jgi:hypothetical protein
MSPSLLGGVNWRESSAHLLLLSKFLRPETPQRFETVNADNVNPWKRAIGEPLNKAIQRFLKEGMLEDAGLAGRVACQFGVEELKRLLRSKGAPTTGVKQVLVDRLVAADAKGMNAATSGLVALVCTVEGRAIAEQYVAAQKADRQQCEDQVIALLRRFDFLGASKMVVAFEARQVFSRGVGIDWKHYDPKPDADMLGHIYTDQPPRILSGLDEYELAHLRQAAALMHLWGTNRCKKWLPKDFTVPLAMDVEAAARMISFRCLNEEALKGYRASRAVAAVEVRGVNSDDTCAACKRLNGSRYALNKAIELPYEHCTSPMGCRCMWVAVLDSR